MQYGYYMSTTLHLVLKHHWFDKIVSGEKTSEYRECSEYWNKRLTNKQYDKVIFHKGYTNTKLWSASLVKSLSTGWGICYCVYIYKGAMG